jgi:hypothetical protein
MRVPMRVIPVSSKRASKIFPPKILRLERVYHFRERPMLGVTRTPPSGY